MSKQIIFTDKAPLPIGPYSQAVLVNGTLYASGQIAIEIAPSGDIVAETTKIMENMGHVLAAADMTYANVVKCQIFLKNLDDFATVNGVYGQYFTENPPARDTVQVAKLPRDVNVEVSFVAVK